MNTFLRAWEFANGFILKNLTAYGTGILISADGYVLTVSSHLLDTSELRVHLYDGRRLTARVVVAEPELDAALLKIDPPQMAAVEEFETPLTLCFTPEHLGQVPHYTSPPKRAHLFAEFASWVVERYAPRNGKFSNLVAKDVLSEVMSGSQDNS